MNARRAAAVFVRQVYLMRGSAARVLPVFAWGTVDIVLWATHIFDEIGSDSRVAVLHKGRVVAEGLASDVAAAEGGLEASFRKLTSTEPVGAAA